MTKMKHLDLILAAALTIGAGICTAAPLDSGTKTKQVAATWFDSLMRGDTAVTTSLSSVPFALDGKQTITSIVELESIFEGIVAKKGKRELKPDSIEILLGEMGPAGAIVIRLMIGDEGIAIFVKPGETYKVIGFRD